MFFLFTGGVREEDSGGDLQLENGAKQASGALLGDLGSEHGNKYGCCAACRPGHEPCQKKPADGKNSIT